MPAADFPVTILICKDRSYLTYSVILLMTGRELPDELNTDEERSALLEKVRGVAAVKLGLIEDDARSAWDTPGIPKMTFVAEAEDYLTSDEKGIKKTDIDLLSRMMSMQKAIPAML